MASGFHFSTQFLECVCICVRDMCVYTWHDDKHLELSLSLWASGSGGASGVDKACATKPFQLSLKAQSALLCWEDLQ